MKWPCNQYCCNGAWRNNWTNFDSLVCGQNSKSRCSGCMVLPRKPFFWTSLVPYLQYWATGWPDPCCVNKIGLLAASLKPTGHGLTGCEIITCITEHCHSNSCSWKWVWILLEMQTHFHASRSIGKHLRAGIYPPLHFQPQGVISSCYGTQFPIGWPALWKSFNQ